MTIVAKSAATFPGGFSVLMSIYQGDSPPLFKRAVDSVFSNTLLPSQLVLVVDGPLKAIHEVILERLSQQLGEQLAVHRLEFNKGLAKALNYGLSKVTTEWVVRADADDINLDNRFQSIATIIQGYPDLDLCGSAILEIDENGRPLARKVPPLTCEEIRRFARRRNPFNHMTVFFRADIIRNLGGYPNIKLKEDYALWCKCIAAGISMANTDKILVVATAGLSMYKRRGGWSQIKSECELQKLMFNLGIKTFFQSWIDGIVRSSFSMIPARLRGFIYIYVLREPLQ